jgi:GLPGLI family protein
MKELILIASIVFLLPIYVNSQTTIDYTSKVNYKLKFQESAIDSIVETAYFNLYFNKEETVFIGIKKQMRDSLLYYRDSSMSFEKFQSLAPKPKFQYRVLRKINDSKLKYVENFVNFNMGYEQNIKLEWAISDETKIIAGFSCIKATVAYAGRSYIAWFTPDIPIPLGPYKFSGLPGLIIKIHDIENHYEFDFIGIETLNPPVSSTLDLDKVEFISKKEFLKKERRFNSNFLTLFNQAGITVDLDESQKAAFLAEQKESYSKKNNPIERID